MGAIRIDMRLPNPIGCAYRYIATGSPVVVSSITVTYIST
jgi:hypothetical protein